MRRIIPFLVILVVVAAPGKAAMEGYDYSVIPDAAEEFVGHLYRCILEREPDTEELESWTQDIGSGHESIRGAFREFFESGEYAAKATSNTYFVTQLYQCMLFRDPNEPALTNYANLLESGKKERYQMFDNFVFCEEFKKKQNMLFGIYPVFRCDSLLDVKDSSDDASPILQDCMDSQSGFTIIDMPAGKYILESGLMIDKPVMLRTEGKDITMQRCSLESHDCAELVFSPTVSSSLLISVKEPIENLHIDHLVFNGNTDNRDDELTNRACVIGSNSFGFVLYLRGADDTVISNSVFKNAKCGAGLTCGSHLHPNINYSEFYRNTIAYNGNHSAKGMWADGMNLKDGKRNAIYMNHFIDNTDIDLVLGGCADCRVQNNNFIHTDDYDGSSFAVISLSAWPDATSGDFTGADISNNLVDCGQQNNCGYGLTIGADAWYQVDPFGGDVHDNTVRNAQQGLTIDDAHDFFVSNNVVEGTCELTYTCEKGCGYTLRYTSDYSIGSRSTGIIAYNPSLSEYEERDWEKGCIPNCKYEITDVPLNDAGFIGQNVPAKMTAEQQYEVSVTMNNTGDTTWEKKNDFPYRLGSQNPQGNQIWGTGRISMEQNEQISPHETKTFTFQVTAPSTLGTYDFQWRMLEENVQWFGELTENVEVVVTEPQCVHRADIPPCNGKIDTTELIAFIGLWKLNSTECPMRELMEAVSLYWDPK